MSPGPLVALLHDDADSRSAPAAWARCVARVLGARVLPVPRVSELAPVLDLVAKRDVRWIVNALRRDPDGSLAEPWHSAPLARLLGRAPRPVVSVQPWARAPSGSPRLAVAGLDRSEAALGAGLAVSELLAGAKAPARLIVAHGTELHPDELAARLPWPRLAAKLQADSDAWLHDAAAMLRRETVRVEEHVALRWASDLISGLARRESADLVALGVREIREGEPAALGPLLRRVLRGTVCPVVTRSGAGPSTGRREAGPAAAPGSPPSSER